MDLGKVARELNGETSSAGDHDCVSRRKRDDVFGLFRGRLSGGDIKDISVNAHIHQQARRPIFHKKTHTFRKKLSRKLERERSEEASTQ